MTGEVYDWHNVHNDECPQNDPNRLDRDCTCKQRVKKERNPDIINRARVREKLLKMASSARGRDFTQVKPSTLDGISSHLEAYLRKLAQDAPRTGKTL